MNRKTKYIFACVFSCMASAIEKSFVIVTASYNNQQWFQLNLDSVFMQKYDNWRLIYIDDFSTDGTADLVEHYVKEKKFQDRVTLIRNSSRRGHLANQYDAINSISKHEIVVNLDGDDWLAHENVLGYLNNIYKDSKVWMTYGQFQFLSNKKVGHCAPLPKEYLDENKIRSLPVFIFSHLRTFYAGLFQKLEMKDLIYEGNFYPRGADMATMYPMVEMAGEHIKFIPEVLYIYNNTNPLSFFWTQDHKLLDAKIRKSIREKTPYKRINKLDFL